MFHYSFFQSLLDRQLSRLELGTLHCVENLHQYTDLIFVTLAPTTEEALGQQHTFYYDK